MSDSDTPAQSNNRANIIAFLLEVCTIVVLANTSQDEFKECMHYGNEYFVHHVTTLVVVCSLIVSTCLCSCLLVSAKSDNGKIFTTIVSIVGGLALLAVYLWTVLILWHKDPSHALFFKYEFWTEVPVTCDKPHWPFVMSYVLYRIMSFIVFFGFVSGGFRLCIGGCVYGGKRCMNSEESMTPTSTTTSTTTVARF